ncbi:hypothetical protein GCM10025880_47250 [Methylorubrum aminovorans]|nr:hypothetical protein GCM10025880_47250 [Methylorubrum aminovorans]
MPARHQAGRLAREPRRHPIRGTDRRRTGARLSRHPGDCRGDDGPCAARPLFFLVDPLDGTRDFLAGNDQYCVNIGLVQGDRPIAAALAAPGLGRVWAAGTTAREAPIREGRPGAFREVHVRAASAEGLVALVSRLHGDSLTDACLERMPIAERRVTSSALKFCLIAAGEADIYVRCVPTMEWDTAAGDHVLTMAGGRVVGPGGKTITYGHHARFYRNGPFAALASPAYRDGLDLPQESAVSYFDRRRAGRRSPRRIQARALNRPLTQS